MSLTKRLFTTFDQIIIYGAKGWIGRSVVDVVFESKLDVVEHEVLLIGTKTEFPHETSLPITIYSSLDARSLIKSRALFVNSAYLRRERLISLEERDYLSQNRELMSFGEELIKQKRVKTFVNLSSGVARQGDMNSPESNLDPYARSKITDEVILKSLCHFTSTNLINCRIFSLSGRFTNEFENLALSIFLSQAINPPHKIAVKSPSTKRTYVDSIDLARVLLELSLHEGTFFIDSGGTLTTLGDLAVEISKQHIHSSLEFPVEYEPSPDYYGDFDSFNRLAANLGISLLGISDQLIETSKAIASNTGNC